MPKVDINILENDKIPEAAKVAYLEHIASKEVQDPLEPQRLKLQGRALWLGVPVVVAAIGIVSAISTGIFNYLLADQQAYNEVLAEERKFQFKIVESELASKKSSAERASVLLFLVRAGVLTTLNQGELRKMAEAALPDSDKQIEIPKLSLTPVNTQIENEIGTMHATASYIDQFFAEYEQNKQAFQRSGAELEKMQTENIDIQNRCKAALSLFASALNDNVVEIDKLLKWGELGRLDKEFHKCKRQMETLVNRINKMVDKNINEFPQLMLSNPIIIR